MIIYKNKEVNNVNVHSVTYSGETKPSVLEKLDVTANGKYVPSASVDGYNEVNVNVPNKEPNLQTKTIEIIENGITNITADSEYDGLNKATVTVNVPSKEPILEELTATENKVYTPNGDGYSKVTVNVPSTEPNLQEKIIDINQNGSTSITVDTGFDGISGGTINVNVIPKEVTLQDKTVEIVSNGSTSITADEGYDGIKSATVNVQVPSKEPNLQEKSIKIIENGITNITVDDGFDGISGGTINVEVPNKEPELEELVATENKVYTPTKDGYSKVTVNVPQTGTSEPSVLEEISITSNGTYTPSEGVDGYNKINVNVPNVSDVTGGDIDFYFSKEELANEYFNPTRNWENDYSPRKQYIYEATDTFVFDKDFPLYYRDKYNYNEVHAVTNRDGEPMSTRFCLQSQEYVEQLAEYGEPTGWNNKTISHLSHKEKTVDMDGTNSFEVQLCSGETKYMKYAPGIANGFSLYKEITNPLNGETYNEVYPLVREGRYYNQCEIEHSSRHIKCIGANLVFTLDDISVEDENTLILNTENSYLTFEGNYFNYFYNGKRYNNLKCTAGATYPFINGVKNVNASNLTNTFVNYSMNNYMNGFMRCYGIETIDLNGINGSENLTKMNCFFQDCTNLKSVDLGVNFHPNTKDLSDMFGGDKYLTEIKNLDKIATNNVTDFSRCFYKCKKLQTIDISNWVINADASVRSMFSGCDSLRKIIMRNTNETTQNKVREALTEAGISDQVTIVTE